MGKINRFRPIQQNNECLKSRRQETVDNRQELHALILGNNQTKYATKIHNAFIISNIK